MANKNIVHTYGGLNQDVSKSKFSNEFYFDANNIRFTVTDSQSSYALTNEKGNELIFQIPTPVINYTTKVITYAVNGINATPITYLNTEINNYNPNQSADQIIIGHANSRTYLLIFTTDNNGFDCVWKMQYNNYELKLLYLRNMGFSENNPIQAISNFENKNIDKVYWVDGVNQLKFLNIEHSIVNKDLENLIDIPINVINMVGEYQLTQPIIDSISTGGSHTSGMIQYGYNLYRINSSQTKISPLSKMVPLSKGSLGGGDLNEVVGAIPSISISNIDPSYTNIKTYAIKYTSYNEVPSVSIIDDREIPSSKYINVYDDGSVISTVSLEEFLFLGSDVIIPKNIATKFNRLFLANYEEKNFTVDLDCRAYSFNNSKNSTVYDDLRLYNGSVTGDPYTLSAVNPLIPPLYLSVDLIKKDSVNINYNTYKFQENGSTPGGEGQYLKYELTKSSVLDQNNKYFKDEEIYRIGIEFFNIYGQFSLPNWIADFKALSGNLEGNYNTLSVTLKSNFFTWLNTSNLNSYDKPIGYKIVIAERTINDRTIVANGMLNGMMVNDKSTKEVNYLTPADVLYVKEKSDSLLKMPNILQRNCNQTSLYGNTKPLRKALHLGEMSNDRSTNTEVHRAWWEDKDTSGRLYQYNTMMQLYSPEILFGQTIPVSSGLKLKVKGSLKNSINNSWSKMIKTDAVTYTITDEGKAIDGLIPQYSSSMENIIGNGNKPLTSGIISHPLDSQAERVTHSMFYRGYGDIENQDVINGSTLVFNEELVDTGIAEDTTDLIFYNHGQRSINTKIENILFFSLSTVTYTVTPSAGFTTVLYDLGIYSDIEGTSLIPGKSLIGVTGVQTISVTSSGVSNNKYFFNIKALSQVTGTITVVATLTSVPSGSNKERTSTGNNFTVGVPFVPTSVFYNKAPINNPIEIYGIPEITEKGQDSTAYNGDYKFRYSNSLKSFYTDGDTHYTESGQYGRRIVSINSYGNRCITFVAGSANIPETWDRPSLESIFLSSGLTGDNNGLIGELIKSDEEIYLGNIYGGNSYEDKTRSNYIEIGDYKKIDQLSPTLLIESPGDTFIQEFRFARIVKTDTEIVQQGVYQLEEIVEFITETSIDLKNRNDDSLIKWDSRFSPPDKDFHKYNKVYSQLPTLIKRRNLNYTTKKISKYDTNIVATKLKSGGEVIDNWTDVQLNEVMTLDGKYGSINCLANFNDEVFALQDKAIAYISISPRIQVEGSDGLAVQLGTGAVLDKYKYSTTMSGTVNKWSVVTTSIGIYYFDLINKSYSFLREGVSSISNSAGMHSYFINNIDVNSLIIDNPIIKTGISSGYDYSNNDVFMTFHQNNKPPFTMSYNETRGKFVSFYDYKPSIYISNGEFFITTSPDVKKIYRQHAGSYNTFYGVYYPSSVTFNVNPEPTKDCVFDNINFKSEVYLNNIDVVDKTITHITAYNDYQNVNKTPVPLVVGRNNNLRRKFRDWNALIPRDGRNRTRAPFIKLKLDFNQPSNNYKFILHDVSVYYTV